LGRSALASFWTGIFIVSFDPAISPLYPPDANFQDSRNLESADPSLASNHNQDKVDLSREVNFRIPEIWKIPLAPTSRSFLEPIDIEARQDSRILDMDTGDRSRRQRSPPGRSRRRTGERSLHPLPPADRHSPEPAQRQLLATQVTDWSCGNPRWSTGRLTAGIEEYRRQLELYSEAVHLPAATARKRKFLRTRR